MTKEKENLFDLSNAALKDRLKSEGISYADNATKKELVSLLNGDAVKKSDDEKVAPSVKAFSLDGGDATVDGNGNPAHVKAEVAEANAEAAKSAELEASGNPAADLLALHEAYKLVLDENASLKAAYLGAANELKETSDRLATFIAGNNQDELKRALETQQKVIDNLNVQNKDLRDANSLLAKKHKEAQDRIDGAATMKGSIDDLPRIA